MTTPVEDRNAATIRAYWQARGYAIHTYLVPAVVTTRDNDHKGPVMVVRSNLVNGFPQSWLTRDDPVTGKRGGWTP